MRIAVVLAGLACMVVGAAIDRRGLGGWDLSTDIDRLTAGAAAVLVVAGLLALASGRNTRVLAGILAGAAIVPTALAVTEAVGTGLPGPSTGVLVVGSAVVVLGVAARALEWKRGAGSSPMRRVVAMVVAVTATALAASVAAAVVVDAPVHAVTTSAVPPAAVGDRADVVRWEWRGDGAVRDVRAAGAGVVVAGDDGVSALDGVTGTERWSFARAGARLTEMIVSPDGRSVVIVHTGTSSRVAVAVLDAMTGERRWETTLDRPPVPLVTNAVVALGTRVEEPDDLSDPEARIRRERLTAHDLGTGATVWTWETPPACGSALLKPVSAVRVVPIESECRDGATLHGLDERTGREAWTLKVRPVVPGGSDYPVRATDGGVALVTAGSGGYVVVDAVSGKELGRFDSGAGFPTPEADGGIQLVGGTPERAIARMDLADGALVPLPPGCGEEAAAAVTDTTVLRLCRRDPFFDVQTGDAAPVPLNLRHGDPFAALSLLRDAFIVPAPGAVVVGVPTNSRAHLTGLG